MAPCDAYTGLGSIAQIIGHVMYTSQSVSQDISRTQSNPKYQLPIYILVSEVMLMYNSINDT